VRKWTKELIQQEALKYQTKIDFLKGSKRAYYVAVYHKILDDVCSHMTPVRKTWDSESIRLEALKYTSRKSFGDGSSSAYGAARRLNILDDVCSHMPVLQTKWTLQSLIDIAKKYTTRGEFNKHEPNAYHTAKDWKVLHIVCSHMPEAFVWSVEGLFCEAKKYGKRSDFFKNAKGAYCAAYDRGILDTVCGHMQKVKTGYNKNKPAHLYVLLLKSKNTRYVGFGVTNSLGDRIKQHELSADKKGFTIELVRSICGDGSEILKLERGIKRKFTIVDSGIKGFRRECVSFDDLNAVLDFVAQSPLATHNLEALDNAQDFQEAVVELYREEMESK